MNPWAISPGDDNSAPSKAEAMRAAQMAIGDTETPDAIRTTALSPAPWEWLSAAEMASLAKNGGAQLLRAGARMVPQAAEKDMQHAVVSNIARNPWATPTDLMYGRNITHIAPRDYGIMLSQTSAQNPKMAGLMMNGSYLRDKYGTDDLGKILAGMSEKRGVYPQLEKISNPEVFGQYNPKTNSIGLNPDASYRGVPDPSALKHGTLLHEFEHASDQYLYPEFISRAEFMGKGSKQIADEQTQMLMDQLAGKGRSNAWNTPERNAKSMEKAGLSRWHYMDSLNPSEKALEIQDRVFNQSRLGDPLHYLEMQSMGHLRNWNSLEGEFAQRAMAQDALNAGKEVHPEIIKKWGLKPQRVLKIER